MEMGHSNKNYLGCELFSSKLRSKTRWIFGAGLNSVRVRYQISRFASFFHAQKRGKLSTVCRLQRTWMFSQGALVAMPFVTMISFATGMDRHNGSLSSSGRRSSPPILASWLIASAISSNSMPALLFLFSRSESLIMLYFSSKLAGQDINLRTSWQSSSVGYSPWKQPDFLAKSLAKACFSAKKVHSGNSATRHLGS